jgi:8-hydroxy-5-deazaflavin:NADPH oxidoreductase
MKIAIVGSGNMGAALGTIWSQAGHQVMFSYSKDAQKLARLAMQNANTAKGTVEEAVAFGDVVMLSVPFACLKDIIANAAIFRNKIIITCVSGLVPDSTGETIGLPTKQALSVAEDIALALPGAIVVEAFNTTFAEVLQIPARVTGNVKPSLFYCGDDIAAKKTITQLIEDCGYIPVNAGNLRTARTMETFATAWVQFAVVAGLFPRIGLHAVHY